MPLAADESLVLSTSPHREERSSPPIKRAARTYGRKRSPAPVLDASSFPEPADEPPYSSIFRTAPQSNKESIPSTSDNEADDTKDSGSESDAPEAPKTSRKFVYGDWRKGLKDIDRDFDEEDSAPPKTLSDVSSATSFGFGTSSLLSNDDETSSTSPSLVNDVFGSSPADRPRPGPSKLTAGSDDEDELFVRRKRISGKAVVQESDSEVEQPTTSPLAGTSPSAELALSAGSRRASETPPTSDNGMPPAKSQLKGKGRASFDRNRSVPPLELEAINDQKGSQTTRTKIRKPTKKELVESIKDRARINVGRDYKIQPTHRASDKYSKTALLAELAGSSIENIATSEDPINPFSSPEKPIVPAATAPLPFPAFPRTPSPSPAPALGPPKSVKPEPVALDEDDDDMPSVLTILQDAAKASAASTVKEELLKRKLELIDKQRKAGRPAEEDDDDLEIVDSFRVAAVEKLDNQHSNHSGKKDISFTRKQQMALAGIRPAKPTGKGKQPEAVRREDFDQQVLLRAKMEARAITKQKEEEWKAIGGTVRKEPESGIRPEDVMHKLASHALKVATANDQRSEAFEAFEDSGDEDSDDGEYKPEERGSASPEPDAMVEDDGDENDEYGDVDVAMGDDAEEEPLEDPESEDVRPRAGRRRMIASDDEDEENEERAPPPPPRPRQAFSALGGREDDDMEIVLDRRSPSTDGGTTNDEGTDKENDLTESRGRQVHFDSPDFDENTPLSLDLTGPRRPLQEISSSAPDTPKPLELRTNLTQLFEAQLRTPQPSLGPALQPLLGGDLGSKGAEGFSQFSQSGRTPGLPGSSSGDLSELFDATTQKLKDNTWSPQGGGLAEAFVEKPSQPNSPKKGLARRDSLSLTQDLAAARTLLVKETQMRKAESVFEKEQEYLLGAAFEASPKAQKERLYVNEYGFLTQTRPNDEAEEYEPLSPSQVRGTRPRSVLQTPHEQKGIPLTEPSTVDPNEDAESPIRPLRRLRKRDTSPTAERVTIAHEKKRRNAFDALQEGAEGEARQKRRKLDAREYVAGEAEESDDEGGFWGLKKKTVDDDEEEDGEDLDRTLETLVDDQDMDDETLAEHLVREKFKEEQALTDKKIEEEAQAIVDGRRRTRRKGRGDLMGEGSEDESDDEENEERRRRMARRLKKREDVEKLESNPLTKAFADTYQSTVLDDDQEFAHLAGDDTQAVLDRLTVRRDGDEDEDDEDDEAEIYDEDETQQRTIDPFEMRQKLLERRKLRGSSPVYDEEDGMDLADTAWVDSIDGEDEPRVAVKTIKTVAAKPCRSAPSGLDPSALDDGFETQDGNLMSHKHDERHQQQGQVWAKREGRNRNAATARSVGAAAVTGLARTKSGGGSLRTGAKSLANGSEKRKPAVKKAESILISKLGDKSSRFTS